MFTQKPVLRYLFIITKIWKQPKCLSAGEWETKSGRYLHTMEYHSARKRNKLLTHLCSPGESQMHSTKWKKPPPKVPQGVIQFMWHSGKGKMTGMENRSVVDRRQGWKEDATAKGGAAKTELGAWWKQFTSWLCGWWQDKTNLSKFIPSHPKEHISLYVNYASINLTLDRFGLKRSQSLYILHCLLPS